MVSEAKSPRPKRPVNGVFLLDKPRGLSSNTALQIVKRLFQAEKAGHTGTLDPLADGLLPICLGEASKFSAYQLEADKGYRADVLLGATTTTGDAEGEVLQRAQVAVDAAQVAAAVTHFLGEIQQIPPMYSALKVQGKPLYAYARAGLEMERKPRTVHIRAIRVLAFEAPRLVIEVQCSAGTYIRTLAEDIGALLGCGAHLTALTRLSSGGFMLPDAQGLPALEALTVPQRDHCLLPVDALVAHLPRQDINKSTARALLFGQKPVVPELAAQPGTWRFYSDQRFLGLAVSGDGGMIAPLRLMRTDGLERT